VTEAVITVPAYFNDSQRQATKEAGEIAGLIMVFAKGSVFKKDTEFSKESFKEVFKVVIVLIITDIISNIVFNGDRLVLSNLKAANRLDSETLRKLSRDALGFLVDVSSFLS
jgi:hypothetical protein